MVEGSKSMHKLINQNTKSPHVRFWTINILKEAFRGHVSWRSNTGVFELWFTAGGKTEISNFSSAIMDEDIGCFDISMNYAHGLEVQ